MWLRLAIEDSNVRVERQRGDVLLDVRIVEAAGDLLSAVRNNLIVECGQVVLVEFGVDYLR